MVHAVSSPPRPARPWRHGAVALSFLAAIGLVVVLNQRAVRGGEAPADPGFHLTNVAAQVGVDFVHHGPTVDAKLDNIAALMGALGASVSVCAVNDDERPDLYLTNSRFGLPNALYLNRGDGTFVDVARPAGVADLLVYKWGYLRLFKNLGNLHFADVTEAAGLRHWMNSNAAVWTDYDR